ncbi:ureidoglycolate lyase [Xylophilus rhododendri]|uniref:Ureidoglycolate lyase n=1 Tax=Xylophilus rhododendri TaxID=2697032 RepID=A0A857JB87_9BURK|nr:ureidoglycolate lyase [Xylophilus rhododendri]QHJ01285.1 ureidoglycolate lyase [Xylophilus rhododendri]
MHRSILPLLPLTAEAFAPFGDVIETEGRHHFPINAGKVQRFHDLADVDVLEAQGKPGISLFVAEPYPMPLDLACLERHPLSSQAFIPLDDRPFLLVVAPAGEQPSLQNIRAFVTDGRQGVNYRRGVWHHVLIAVGQRQTFAVVDRIGQGPNCDLFELVGEDRCRIDPAAR